MLNPAILENADRFRKEFQSAKPFRHLCVDDFFDAGAAEALLRDFPEFDRNFAKNEFGATGGKAARPDIRQISPAYRQLFDYLASAGFLKAVSDVTGIPDLLFDARMYGGGTHENKHGQDLDPHVDFNYDENYALHRRLNLIVYLNKTWDRSWGGAIELHSNPRRPAENRIKEFEPLFNRAILFETNEHSWHGFRRIQLPEGQQLNSRKSISIYLYTKDRPAEEIAPAHGTFYIPRPLPEKLRAGYTLLPEDMAVLKDLIQRRDGWIEYYQKLELGLSRTVEERTHYLQGILASVRIPCTGYVQQEPRSVRGMYVDGWVGLEGEVRLKPLEHVVGLVVRGFVPDFFPQPNRLIAAIDGVDAEPTLLRTGEFEYRISPEKPLSKGFTLNLRCSEAYNGARLGESKDRRDLAFQLIELRAIHKP